MGLLDEIASQPELVRELASAHAECVTDLRRLVPKPGSALIAARGTSDNAATYAKYLWAIRNRLSVALAAPSLYTAYDAVPILSAGCLVVAISQSGESPDLIQTLVRAGRIDQPRLAVTNAPASPLATAATIVVDIGAGVERAVAATRSYIAELVKLLQLSLAWDAGSYDLRVAADGMETVFDQADMVASAAERFAEYPGFAVVSRGLNLATAREWALKLTETANVNARPFSVADFRHGPVAMADSQLPLLAVAMEGPVAGDVMELVQEMQDRRSVPVVLITNLDGVEADVVVRVPRMKEALSPLVSIVAGQIFSHNLALARGLDPDQPRGLRKITRTV